MRIFLVVSVFHIASGAVSMVSSMRSDNSTNCENIYEHSQE